MRFRDSYLSCKFDRWTCHKYSRTHVTTHVPVMQRKNEVRRDRRERTTESHYNVLRQRSTPVNDVHFLSVSLSLTSHTYTLLSLSFLLIFIFIFECGRFHFNSSVQTHNMLLLSYNSCMKVNSRHNQFLFATSRRIEAYTTVCATVHKQSKSGRENNRRICLAQSLL